MAVEFEDPAPSQTPAELKKQLLAEQPIILDDEDFDEATVRRATLAQLREDPVLYMKYLKLQEEDLATAERENVILFDGSFDTLPLDEALPITRRENGLYQMPRPVAKNFESAKELRARFVHWHKGRKPRHRRNWFR